MKPSSLPTCLQDGRAKWYCGFCGRADVPGKNCVCGPHVHQVGQYEVGTARRLLVPHGAVLGIEEEMI